MTSMKYLQDQSRNYWERLVIYKTRNGGRRNAGNGGTLYSGECHQIFWGMSSPIAEMFLLLKEMRIRGQVKISSCSFCVWCKSRELGARGSPRVPCATAVVESFSSDLPRAMISYSAESHLESCQTSKMELFCENS